MGEVSQSDKGGNEGRVALLGSEAGRVGVS